MMADQPAHLSPAGVVEAFMYQWSASDLSGVMPMPGVLPGSGVVELNSIGVPDAHQGKGYASAALRMLTDLCDANGVTITLTPRPLPDQIVPGCTATRSIEELASWYGRHGFEIVRPNEYTFDMIRRPR